MTSRKGTCENEMKEGQQQGCSPETTVEKSCRSKGGGKIWNSVLDILSLGCQSDLSAEMVNISSDLPME